MKVWIQRYTYIKLSKYLLLKFYTFHYTLTILVFNLDVDAIYLLNNISCFNENKDLYAFLILYNWHISCNKEKLYFLILLVGYSLSRNIYIMDSCSLVSISWLQKICPLKVCFTHFWHLKKVRYFKFSIVQIVCIQYTLLNHMIH